jgi:O-antigen ligase
VPTATRRAADVLLGLLAVSIPLSTTGMEIGVAGLGALTVVAAVRGWPAVRRTPLDGVLALFYGVLAVSTLASGRPAEAVGWVHSWVVLTYFVVFWWLPDREGFARFVRLVVIAGTIAAAYGLLQHFTGADWYRTLLGRRTYVRPREPGASGYAVVGFFRNYLTFAHVMVVPFAWAAAFALAGRVAGLVGALVIVVALVFSTARGAWLAVLAVAGALLLIDRGQRVLVTLAAVAAAGCVALAVTPDLRAEATQMFARGGANTGRLAIYATNLDILHAHPVLGLGFGRYETAARPYYEAHPDADRRSHAHNNFLHVAAESGLVGLAAFGLIWATALRRGWQAVRATDAAARAPAAGAWAALVGFLVGGLTQYTFGDAEVVIAMWAALAVLMRSADAAAGAG